MPKSESGQVARIKQPAPKMVLTSSEDRSSIEVVTTEAETIKRYFARLGKKGGSKGGRARMASLTPKQRSELARKAAAARWAKK